MKKSSEPKGFVCYTRDEYFRTESSSGGVFYELSKKILSRNKSFVYGAGYSKNFEVNHMKTDKTEDIILLTGSKYVQSNIRDIFRDIKDNLKKNAEIMFVGTPCQVKGLYNYLQRENADINNMLLIDFICHGVSSPKIFREYLEEKRKKYKSDINQINFRNKKNGWHDYSMYIRFENGKEYSKSHYTDEYMHWFLTDCSIRSSCLNCPMRDINQSKSDITLGDAWLEKTERKAFDQGKSLVIANTEKGLDFINSISDNLVIEETDYLKYFKSSSETMSPEKREQFFRDYCRLGEIRKLKKKYYYNKRLMKGYLKHLLYSTDLASKLKH